MLESQTPVSLLNSSSKDALLRSIARKITSIAPLSDEFLNSLFLNYGFTRFDAFHLAIILKEMGRSSDAIQIIKHNTSHFGEDSSELYELSILIMISDKNQGIELLKKSISIHPTYESCRFGILVSFFAKDLELRRFIIGSVDAALLDIVYSENSKFIRYLATIGQNTSWSTETGIFSLSPISIDETTDWFEILEGGGSIIRLGDGEGAMFRFSEDEEAVLYDIYRENRRHFFSRWIGANSDTAAYEAGAAELSTRWKDFDLVGIPNPAWLMKSFASADYRGFSCAWNVVRKICLLPSAATQRFVRTSAIHDFLYRKKIRALVEDDPSIAVISWNNFILLTLELEGYQGKMEFIKINPAVSDVSNALHLEDISRANQYEIILEAGQQILTGSRKTVFVAGGYLAKVASLTWQKHGHRIIDVGSAFDVSIGLPIR